MRSAPRSHHSGSAASNSQRLSAAASAATSLMRTASTGEGLRSSPWRAQPSLLAAGPLAFSVLYCTKRRQPSANSGQRARTGASSRHLKGSRLQEPVLVTGAAGFIGMHVARRLLADGHDVVGLDNLNAYYDPRLKQARLAELEAFSNFKFVKMDIGERK